MYRLQINPEEKTPKYKQIVSSVIHDIGKGILKRGDHLPSINYVSEEYYLGRDTVEKAYRELKELGYISSVAGKGFYVEGAPANKIRVLLVMNKLSSYKKIVYYSFLKALGDKATVDLHIHHYNAALFREIIEKNLGKYHYYVVIPHFYENIDKVDIQQTLEQIPRDELILLDKDLPEVKGEIISVYQDFEKDIYQALETGEDLLKKYERVVLVFPSDGNYPQEIARGFKLYCIHYQKKFAIIENAMDEKITSSTAYIVIEETDLAEIIKKIRQTPYEVGKEVGLVSFNDATLKELLSITVITTDFETMGRTAAALLLDKKKLRIKTPFSMIRRQSL
ncbi:GntR family transcriptional regulator [Cytophagaceae bacterium DM2B3-1]|uniref:GntR family transcriptional regulator n=1 Tax=Xanthocytophaga flava TaxID=3048013 RepID=A0ABT7CSQ6_9BACT|nr:GntR family transcriptional regulator [Xanthocytophaga flavus]MDJ1495684.1 GntR family transcriptional regulator [Xanthocytophaga flavus]